MQASGRGLHVPHQGTSPLEERVPCLTFQLFPIGAEQPAGGTARRGQICHQVPQGSSAGRMVNRHGREVAGISSGLGGRGQAQGTHGRALWGGRSGLKDLSKPEQVPAVWPVWEGSALLWPEVPEVGVQGQGPGPGRLASPLHSCSSSCRAELPARHPSSMCGVKQSFSRTGATCSCCLRGATEVWSHEMRAPPATVQLRQRSTTTSATVGTCAVRVGGARCGVVCRAQECGCGRATLGLALQRLHVLPVGGGVDVDGGDAGGQAQTTLLGVQDGHLQHGVQEGHPVVLPQQLACAAWGGGAVSLGRGGLSPQPDTSKQPSLHLAQQWQSQDTRTLGSRWHGGTLSGLEGWPQSLIPVV